MTDQPKTSIDQSTLLKFARAALTRAGDDDQIPWEDFDLSDPEQRQFGDYELLELLGRGGMGVVYRAVQGHLNREVAIKFIATHVADDPSFVGKFLDEARAAARLHHPHIIPVFEVGSHDFLHYFTMPLMRGKTLDDLANSNELTQKRIVDLMRKLCSAVSYAHSLGMLHLDLKPSNIMMDEHDEPLVGDFGLARQVDDRGEVTAQEVSGTPAFMAPEQVQIKQSPLTRQTDIYALGAILFRLLTGQSPHGKGSAEVLMDNAVGGRVPPVRSVAPGINKDLAAICDHCLQLRPQERYRSADELNEDLGRLADGNDVSVRSPSITERLRRLVTRHPAATIASGAALAALMVGAITTTWQWQVAEEARRTAETRATRMGQLASMIAVIHPETRDPRDAIKDPVSDLVTWLKQNGGSPEDQKELLVAFIDALKGADKGDALEELLWSIQQEMGMDFRKSIALELAASDTVEDLIAAALMLPDDHPQTSTLVARLDARSADNALALIALASMCGHDTVECDYADLRRRLREHAPEFISAWTLGYESVMDPDSIRSMAAQQQLSDGLAEISALIFDRTGAYEAPEQITVPLQAFLMDAKAVSMWAKAAASLSATPAFQRLIWPCHPKRPEYIPELHSECLTIARRLFNNEHATLISRMVGSSMVRRLSSDPEEISEALALRRQYVWIMEEMGRREIYLVPSTAYISTMTTDGEWAALLESATSMGIPTTPTDGWQPEDEEALMLPENRPSRQPGFSP